MREMWGVKMNLQPEIALARPKWFIWSHLACTIDVWRWTFSHSLFFLFRLKKCRTTVQSRKRWRADIWFLSCVEFHRIFRTRYVRQWVEIRDPWQFSLDVMKTVFKMRSDESKHVTSVSQSHVWNSIEAATQTQIDIFSKKYNDEQERLFKDRFHQLCWKFELCSVTSHPPQHKCEDLTIYFGNSRELSGARERSRDPHCSF